MTPNLTNKKTLLIVEDSQDVRSLFVKRAKARLNLNCLEDDSGEKCLEICHKNKPDVVVLDMGLPRISGLSLLRMIKEDRDLKNIPVIAYSAYAYKELVDECYDLGVDSYFTKSSPMSEIFDRIQEQLH